METFQTKKDDMRCTSKFSDSKFHVFFFLIMHLYVVSALVLWTIKVAVVTNSLQKFTNFRKKR